ncbi:hypothetical protein D3C87_1441030 [compost metagenome]
MGAFEQQVPIPANITAKSKLGFLSGFIDLQVYRCAANNMAGVGKADNYVLVNIDILIIWDGFELAERLLNIFVCVKRHFLVFYTLYLFVGVFRILHLDLGRVEQ